MKKTNLILKRLKDLRVKRDLPQDFMARGLKVDRTTYVRKEKGDIPITTEEWIKIASLLDVDVAMFFIFVDSSSKNDEDIIPLNKAEKKEKDLLNFFRALSDIEKKDMIETINLTFKRITSKSIHKLLSKLIKK